MSKPNWTSQNAIYSEAIKPKRSHINMAKILKENPEADIFHFCNLKLIGTETISKRLFEDAEI